MSTTPVEYFAAIAETAYPNVDVGAVTPSVDEVALLLQTRTVSPGGGAQGTFTDDAGARPSATQVAGLIGQATIVILEQLREDVPVFAYPRIRQAVALQAAILVENSFFLEQVKNGQSNAPNYVTLLTTVMGGLTNRYGEGTGQRRRVGSVVIRSTMTDYDPIYPLPTPRQIIEYLTAAEGGSAPGGTP